MPLLILDRDGVINQDSDDYIRGIDDWLPIPGSIEAIAGLSRAGYQVAIVTNQSGLSRGHFTLDDLEAIHSRLRQQVQERGGYITGIFYCPHLPQENCSCRKPATGLLQAVEDELLLSTRGALFIGDSLKDLQAARAFGCSPVLVKTGKGAQTLALLRGAAVELDKPGDIPVFDDLASAARDIIQNHPATAYDPKHDI